jgi:hypothetical protein
VDRYEPELVGTGVDEAMRRATLRDHDVTTLHFDLILPKAEPRPAGFDNEYFRVWVAMEARPYARRRLDQDDRERHVTVLGADELAGMRSRSKRFDWDHGGRKAIRSSLAAGR